MQILHADSDFKSQALLANLLIKLAVHKNSATQNLHRLFTDSSETGHRFITGDEDQIANDEIGGAKEGFGYIKKVLCLSEWIDRET